MGTKTFYSYLIVSLTFVSCGPGLAPFPTDDPPRSSTINPCSATIPAWETVDDFVVSGLGPVTTISNGLAVASDNNVFAVVYHTRGTGPQSLWLVRKGANGGATWSTVDSFGYSTSIFGANSTSIWIDPLSRLFVQGVGFDAADIRRWLIRISSDGGSTWSTLNDYTYNASYPTFPAFNQTAPMIDNDGHWLVLGQGDDATSTHWLTRKSTDEGATWSVIFDYQYAAGFPSSPRSQTKDEQGFLYQAGLGADTSNITHWLVLRSADNGATWHLLDDFQLDSTKAAGAKGLLALPGNILIATGSATDSSNVSRWITRRSTDGGGSWQIVDNLPTASAAQSDIIQDARGYLYIGGYRGAVPNRVPLVRKSTDNGITWADDDSLVGDNSGSSAFRALATGPDNALYSVAQTVETAVANNHIIVRKLRCQN